MNVAVLNTQIPFCVGGAEQLAEDLVGALMARGHNATIITVPYKWYPQQSLLDSIVACKLLDISDFNDNRVDKTIALKFPLWLIPHDDMALWICHQHRGAYDLWDSDFGDLALMRDSRRVRDLIRREDTAAISARDQVFTISQNVANRLQKYNQLSAGVLHPPPRNMEKFYFEEYGDFFFFPSRILPLKRQELVIEALAHVESDMKVVFAGAPDSDEYFDSLCERAEALGVSSRIQWLGSISEERKFEMYAKCRMVIFPALDEDYGYITPEAMLSSKGVVTLEDSGGSLEFVTHDETGSVVAADAATLGAELDRLWQSPEIAKTYGENALARVTAMNLSWDHVVENLLQS